MCKQVKEAVHWAHRTFGAAELGDVRRRKRLVQVAARVLSSPGGRVSAVFAQQRERNAAYDFLENEHVDNANIMTTVGRATAALAADLPFMFVAIDGSSISVVDRAHAKGAGIVGTVANRCPGMEVVTSLGIAPDGTSLGIVDQRWWARRPVSHKSPQAKTRRNRKRKTREKETQFWCDAADVVHKRADEAGATAWIQIDREGDARPILTHLANRPDHYFTVRSCWNRRLVSPSGAPMYLAQQLKRGPVIARFEVNVPAAHQRTARTACMHVRAIRVQLRLRNQQTKAVTNLWVTAISTYEVGTTPRGEKRLEWRLLTNYPVAVSGDVLDVIRGYTMRWRIEDFHRTWKSAGCRVEEMQLRSKQAVIKWATILAAVATRIEQLKHLARTQSEQLATVALSDIEIRALILLKRSYTDRPDEYPDKVPTIATAVTWIAELGGYTGKSSGGPPGSQTIGRGFEKLQTAVKLLEAIERDRK